MANYNTLKTAIDANIKQNGVQAITGNILNGILNAMVNALGAGYQYMGVAEPTTDPGTPDPKVFYFALEEGTYTHFSSMDVTHGISVLRYEANGTWSLDVLFDFDDIFSGNNTYSGNNTFNGYTRFGDEVDVYFENMYDLEDGETLREKLASLVTAIATKISKVTGAVEDNLATFDENGNVKDSGVSLANIDEKIDECAKADGISEKLVSGSARGILSPSAIEELFLYQRTANGAGGTGAAVFQSIKGNSIVWNQLVDADTTEVTIPSGHKYVSIIAGVSALATSDGTPISVTGGTDCVFDLTQMGLADLTLAQFQALYPPMAYAPNPGAILNNAATGMVTDGLNQWDEEWEFGALDATGNPTAATNRWCSKNFCRIFADKEYHITAPYAMVIYFYDANYNFIYRINTGGQSINFEFTPNVYPGVCYFKMSIYGVDSAGYANNICINISGSRNGEYEPHWSDTSALPITTATGKLNGEGESMVISPNGLAGVGTSFDEGVVEKGMWTKDIIRRARVDLGGEDTDWTKYDGFTNPIFYSNAVKDKAKRSINALCSKYICVDDYPNNMPDKSFCMHYGGANYTQIYIRDDSYSDAAAFKAAMDGVMLEYELATPEEYILDTPVPVVARVDENGTQTILPQGVDEQGTPMTAPFKASIQYPVKLGVAPIGQQSLVNLLERMKSAGTIASYTMVWDAAAGVYDFTIS